MKIEEINIIVIKPKKGLVAIANCVLRDDKRQFAMYLNNIGIVATSDGGFRISFPFRTVGKAIICDRCKDEIVAESEEVKIKKFNYYHPINRFTLGLIDKPIIERYLRLKESLDE